MKILSVDQMVEVDRLTSQMCSLPSILLMENAGIQLYLALEQTFGPKLGEQKIAIICGKGNNGGDGLVLARQLLQRRIHAEVYLLGKVSDVGGDAAVNLETLLRSGQIVHEVPDSDHWRSHEGTLNGCTVLVDAILGTGLTKPLRGLYAEAVQAINRSPAFVLSVDIPSGMSADSTLGGVLTVRADLTVTFTAPKIAHVLNEDQEALGELKVAPIGSPSFLMEGPEFFLELIQASDVAELFPPRPAAGHKGRHGHVAIVAGSRGKSGAGVLSSMGALRFGAGLVTLCTPDCVQGWAAAGRPEIMTIGLNSTGEGTVAADSVDRLIEFVKDKAAVGVGPGLTAGTDTRRIVEALLSETDLPLVLDADAINVLSGSVQSLECSIDRPVVFTPHPGEFARLLRISIREVLQDKIRKARDFATQHKVWLVFKDFRTLIADPSGRVLVSPRGNPGMATAGMGDVLTGMITASLGMSCVEGKPPAVEITEAVASAVYLHGLAGDLAVRGSSPESLVAGDLLEHLGAAFTKTRNG